MWRIKMGMDESMKALAHPVRRQILENLKKGSKTAGEIADKFDLTKATVSYHLKILKSSGFVEETKIKNFIYYNLNMTVFEDILKWFSDLKGGQNEKN